MNNDTLLPIKHFSDFKNPPFTYRNNSVTIERVSDKVPKCGDEEHDHDLTEITIENGVLSAHWLGTYYTYDIEMSRIKSASDILRWVLHLQSKLTWDEYAIEAFVELCANYRKLDDILKGPP